MSRLTCELICWPRVALGAIAAIVIFSPFIALIVWWLEIFS